MDWSRDIYAALDEKEDSSGELDYDSDDPVFEIGLQPTADENSGYHTKNDHRPGRQYHREDVTQRKGAIGIRCNMVDVVHGKWGPDESAYATLIVFLFRFDVKKASRRIARVDITIDFWGNDPNEPDSRPEVHAISFDGSLSIAEQKQSESSSRSIEGKAGITVLQAAELSNTMTFTKSVSRDTTSYTKIVGNMYRKTYDYGPADQVNWVLLENETMQTGVPVAFRAGVLLKREDKSPYQCDVKIKAKADVRSTLEDFFGSRTDETDPVLFNPEVQKKIKLAAVRDHDRDALGSFDLESISDVTFLHIDEKAIKRS